MSNADGGAISVPFVEALPMGSRVRRSVVLIFVLALGIRVAAVPDPIAAAGSCRADFAILGQAPGLTGATPTDWFNVFGTEFDASVPATLTFGVPVIPWSIDQPTVVQAAVTTFAVPAADMAAGFKWTFRSRDRGVRSISVVVAGLDCQAKTVIKFALPATSTAEPSAPSQPLPVGPLALLLAFAGGVSAAWRRSGHHS